MSNVEFAFQWAFIILPLPLFIWFLLPPAKINKTAALRAPFFKELNTELNTNKRTKPYLKLFFGILAWLLLVIASARPQFIGESISQPITGRSLMMAVDISGSMQARDMQIESRNVTRLTAVKSVAGDFISKREGDRIGLILFGSNAYLQAPLTFDRKTVKTLLHEAELGLAGRATAIGDAIGLAVKRLRKESEENRVLILLTDGANTAGNVDPLKAADLAAQEKVKVYTIGVGGKERIVQTPFGRQRVGGNDLDEPTLRAIAEKTKGRFFRAQDVEGLLKIYKFLDEIEPVSKDELSYRPIKELYYYPLALALGLSALMLLFSSSLFSFLRPAKRANQTKPANTVKNKGMVS